MGESGVARIRCSKKHISGILRGTGIKLVPFKSLSDIDIKGFFFKSRISFFGQLMTDPQKVAIYSVFKISYRKHATTMIEVFFNRRIEIVILNNPQYQF
jgi:hypothetical protein